MATFLLELVSPEKLLLSRAVEMATIPAEDALRGGVIRVRENGAETEALFIAGGFAEVSPERVTILADEATPLASLSRASAERRLAEAEAALQEAIAEPEPRRDAAYARVQAFRTAVAVAQAA